MSNDFVHLHVHSEFSLLDGLGRVEKLVQRAQRLGQPALALTDHGAMHGVIPFFRAAKGAGIHPVIGVEAYLTRWGRPMQGRDSVLDKDRHHLLLLAQNQTGYRNLLKICSDAQMQGYYYRPRIDADYLASHSEGLICTTGCLAGEVPALLNGEKGARPQEKLALERLHWYLDIFGKDRFYIELQEHDIPSLREVNKTLLDWSKRHDIDLVATNDVHYVEPEDARYHDVLLCVQTTSLLHQADRMRMSDASYYLKSGQEMRDLFRPLIDLPESAFTNTLRIAEMCQVNLEDKTFHLPDIDVPEGQDYQSYLREVTEEGLRWRYGTRADDADVQARKEHELKIIHQMGFDVYFLIVADLCRYARGRGIWYNVRGSGAGSIVAYATGITGIDPLSNNLVFERFLNPGRVSMPDFDLDFPDDQREEMIRYTIDKYGAEHVAQIVSFGRMKARAAVRDVARVLDIPLAEVDRIAKQIPAIPGKPVTIEQCLGKDEKKPELATPELIELYQGDPKVKELLDTASALEGVARHASTHAAAVIVTDQPLTAYLPVMRPQKAVITEAVTQFEFPICESIGLLKVDFLGLATLTVMREATKLIRQRHGVEWTLDNIPLDDPESYKLLSSGEVSGVFQVEGAGLRRMLTEMQPREFNHIVAAISLYRPGPMDFIPEYVAVMHGKKEAEYVHPALEPILAETYGVCVYQEQVILLLTDIAGYTASEADNVRRAISKKSEKTLLQHREIFAKGAAQKSGLKRQETDAIWDALLGFARYGFNRSHAADYAVITVQTAYLKAHYPLEYMAAMLYVERDNPEKVAYYITEARRMGIEVLPPDVNASSFNFTVEQSDGARPAARDLHIAYPFPTPPGAAIRYGLAAIKNVGEGPVEAILAGRQAGPFPSLEALCQRVDLRKVGKKALECMIKVGALDQFGERAQLLEGMEQMVGVSRSHHEAEEAGQLSMFDLFGGGLETTASFAPTLALPSVAPLNPKQRLEMEKELLGVYVSSHPLQQMAVDLSGVVTCTCGELGEAQVGKSVVLAGNVVRVNQITTKKGDRMAFVTLEDLQGQCDVVVFPKTWEESKELWVQDRIVLVRGKAEKRGESVNVLCDSVQTYVNRALAADDGDPYADLRGAPTFVDGNSSGRPAAPPRPAAAPPWSAPSSAGLRIADGDETLSYGAEAEDAGEDGNPFALEEPDWLREAPAPWEEEGRGERLMGNGERLMGNGERLTVNGERLMGNGEVGTVNGERLMGNGERLMGNGEGGTARVEPVAAGARQQVDAPAVQGTKPPAAPSAVQGSESSVVPSAVQGSGSSVVPSAVHGSKSSVAPSTVQGSKSPVTQSPSREIRVTVQRTHDAERDKRLLGWVVDALRAKPGPDRFCIVVRKNGAAVQLDFPNDRTAFSPELEQQLVRRLGVGSVEVREGGGR
ncbi:MAG TPA: DNA polymerase III subunit alpha [Anaerolineae bacterium]|nr:DNA polymerase III subunit alpha [Anaerolineae bacterium]HNU03117.1 DNA polymerase III subunit alpha [Anaerolineae bacterium]